MSAMNEASSHRLACGFSPKAHKENIYTKIAFILAIISTIICLASCTGEVSGTMTILEKTDEGYVQIEEELIQNDTHEVKEAL